MIWDHENRRPVPGSFRPKHALLDKLLLEGWLHDDPSGRAADGLLEFILDEGLPMDKTLENHYRDIVNGHLSFIKDLPKEELYMRLYFCDGEEDILDMLRDGLGDTDTFIRTYAGYSAGKPGLTASPERLERFCEYMERWDPRIRPRIDFIRSLSAAFPPEDFYMGGIISYDGNHS